MRTYCSSLLSIFATKLLIIMNYKGLKLQEDQARKDAMLVYADGIFGKCTPYYNNSPVQDISEDGVFNVPEFIVDNCGIGYKVVSISLGAFDCMRNIQEIYIPKSVNSIKWCFWECYNLQRFVVDPANEKYCDIDGVLYSKNKRELIAYPNAKGDEYRVPNGVRRIGNCAFKSTKITSITMPASLRKIGVNAFYGCKHLREILDIPTGIAEVGKIINPNSKHNINTYCRMLDGEVVSLSSLTERYPRKKK